MSALAGECGEQREHRVGELAASSARRAGCGAPCGERARRGRRASAAAALARPSLEHERRGEQHRLGSATPCPAMSSAGPWVGPKSRARSARRPHAATRRRRARQARSASASKSACAHEHVELARAWQGARSGPPGARGSTASRRATASAAAVVQVASARDERSRRGSRARERNARSSVHGPGVVASGAKIVRSPPRSRMRGRRPRGRARPRASRAARGRASRRGRRRPRATRRVSTRERMAEARQRLGRRRHVLLVDLKPCRRGRRQRAARLGHQLGPTPSPERHATGYAAACHRTSRRPR